MSLARFILPNPLLRGVPLRLPRQFPTSFVKPLRRFNTTAPLRRELTAREPAPTEKAAKEKAAKEKAAKEKDAKEKAARDTKPTGVRSEVATAPLRSEEAKAAPIIAREDYFTIPNLLTYTRILTTPVIGYFILSGQNTAAFSVFVYSSVTDFVDGFIARRFNMKSVLGSILDPMADKFLMTVCTVTMAMSTSMPLAVAGLIIGRDVMLLFMGFYYRWRSLTSPRTLGKFFDLGNSTLSVHPNMLGKVTTTLQMVYIGGLVCKPVVMEYVGAEGLRSLEGLGGLDGVFDVLGVVVAGLTVVSGGVYVFGRSGLVRRGLIK